MSIKNILIFPAGTEIAFEIYNALKYSKFVRLFGGTSVECHADFVFERCIGGLPFVDDKKLIESLNRVIEENNIDYIYPAHDSVIMELTRRQNELKAAVVTSPLETVEICRSKNKTYEYLAEENYIPEVYNSEKDIDLYPVFIKPSVGQGAVGARRIDTREELITALSDRTEYTICEYLPGDEYTVDCFTDRHGNLRVVKFRQRERIRSGIAVRSRIIDANDNIKAIAENINKHFKFNGAWFFQVKKNLRGEYKLMEISPRIPGTMGISRNLGINFPLLTLYNMWGYDVSIIDNGNEILLDRAFISRFKTDISYTDVYVDFDDTLVVNDKVNVQLIMFLYQALNKGKKIHLLTKHANNINESLKKYRISEDIFDEIIHISQDKEKSQYISGNAIFIDDSFSERRNVSEKCNIPVFDLDMIESLLDWRM